MRTRIALATAVAVIIAIPTLLFTFFSSTPAGSVGTVRHEAIGLRHGAAPQRVVRINDKLMSYAQARKVAQMVTYANAVQAQKEATFIKDLAFFQAVAAQQRANSAAAIPAAWMPTAICEEGGRDDPYAGYFGILAWGGFDGYPTAGSAPLSVQLAWEAAHGQGPPDAPGQCHSY